MSKGPGVEHVWLEHSDRGNRSGARSDRAETRLGKPSGAQTETLRRVLGKR